MRSEPLETVVQIIERAAGRDATEQPLKTATVQAQAESISIVRAPNWPHRESVHEKSMTYERAAIFMLGGGPQAHEVCCRNFLAGNRVDLIADAFNMWTKVVMSTVFLKNISDFGKTNEVYATYFKANPPARTKVGVAALPGDALVGIDVIAQQ